MEWRKARREGKKGSASKMRKEENWTEKRRKFKSEWAGQLHNNTLTCSCTAIGLHSVVQLLQTALVWLLSGVQRIRGVYSTVPWAKWKIYCQNHTCCHSTYTGPSICLILLWAQRQRERCVWGGISLPPLIPSLGHPPSLAHVLHTVIALAYWKGCRETYASTSIHTVTQPVSHTVKSTWNISSFPPVPCSHTHGLHTAAV